MRQTRTIESFNRVIQYFNNDDNVADLERRRGGFEHAAKYIDQATDYFLTQLNKNAQILIFYLTLTLSDETRVSQRL